MLIHFHKGRTWTEVERKPHTRRDGSATRLIVWSSPCTTLGCRESVLCTTPENGYTASKAFEATHCNLHKLTRSEALARAKAQKRSQRA